MSGNEPPLDEVTKPDLKIAELGSRIGPAITTALSHDATARIERWGVARQICEHAELPCVKVAAEALSPRGKGRPKEPHVVVAEELEKAGYAKGRSLRRWLSEWRLVAEHLKISAACSSDDFLANVAKKSTPDWVAEILDEVAAETSPMDASTILASDCTPSPKAWAGMLVPGTVLTAMLHRVAQAVRLDDREAPTLRVVARGRNLSISVDTVQKGLLVAQTRVLRDLDTTANFDAIVHAGKFLSDVQLFDSGEDGYVQLSVSERALVAECPGRTSRHSLLEVAGDPEPMGECPSHWDIETDEFVSLVPAIARFAEHMKSDPYQNLEMRLLGKGRGTLAAGNGCELGIANISARGASPVRVVIPVLAAKIAAMGLGFGPTRIALRSGRVWIWNDNFQLVTTAEKFCKYEDKLSTITFGESFVIRASNLASLASVKTSTSRMAMFVDPARMELGLQAGGGGSWVVSRAIISDANCNPTGFSCTRQLITNVLRAVATSELRHSAPYLTFHLPTGVGDGARRLLKVEAGQVVAYGAQYTDGPVLTALPELPPLEEPVSSPSTSESAGKGDSLAPVDGDGSQQGSGANEEGAAEVHGPQDAPDSSERVALSTAMPLMVAPATSPADQVGDVLQVEAETIDELCDRIRAGLAGRRGPFTAIIREGAQDA